MAMLQKNKKLPLIKSYDRKVHLAAEKKNLVSIGSFHVTNLDSRSIHKVTACFHFGKTFCKKVKRKHCALNQSY
ncbi:hypothetical protein [Cardinium endosymbiont of Oedothorax gibbosus]|uniref:hypothetical protein n=1 Tax=Cardinium endosymbiont of Oedothorax gibbosus TaxID=931101 RepID=UPI003F6CBAD3